MTEAHQISVAIASALALLTGCGAERFAEPPPHVVPLEARSADGTRLRGQLDLPADAPARAPLAVLLPGTGVFDRDVHYARDMLGEPPYDPRGLLFRDLARGLAARGVAALRWDQRGARCSRATLPGSGAGSARSRWLSECVDDDARRGITPESIRRDAVAMVRAATPHVDASRLVGVGHSEGSIHWATMVERGDVKPAGLVFFGMVGRSPRELVRWQLVERTLARVRRADRDGDGELLPNEWRALPPGKRHTLRKRVARTAAALSEQLGERTVSVAELSTEMDRGWQRLHDDLLTADPRAAYERYGSVRWRQMWFFDDRRVVDRLLAFDGPVVAHLGGHDPQVPVRFVRAAVERSGAPVQLVVHPGVGHSLGDHALFGPMREDVRRALLADIVRLATMPAESRSGPDDEGHAGGAATADVQRRHVARTVDLVVAGRTGDLLVGVE